MFNVNITNHKDSNPIWSCTEWDRLQEVIVGDVVDAHWPPHHEAILRSLPDGTAVFLQTEGARPVSSEIVESAARELDNFVKLLESMDVTVYRPERIEHATPIRTPFWEAECGLGALMPRDVALVIADQIIEVPMAWRCRQFEVHAYRQIFKEKFLEGGRWAAAPRPSLPEHLFKCDLTNWEKARFTEFEPTFDAADFLRFGRDIVGQLSNVTNRFGVEWLRRALGPEFRVHLVEFHDVKPFHIDATILPLAPGKLLANPERVLVVPEIFRDWEVRYAPLPDTSFRKRKPLLSSHWISMNLLSVSEDAVIVEEGDSNLIKLLEAWGFTVFVCKFENFQVLGGSFHYATLDLKRSGQLISILA